MEESYEEIIVDIEELKRKKELIKLPENLGYFYAGKNYPHGFYSKDGRYLGSIDEIVSCDAEDLDITGEIEQEQWFKDLEGRNAIRDYINERGFYMEEEENHEQSKKRCLISWLEEWSNEQEIKTLDILNTPEELKELD